MQAPRHYVLQQQQTAIVCERFSNSPRFHEASLTLLTRAWRNLSWWRPEREEPADGKFLEIERVWFFCGRRHTFNSSGKNQTGEEGSRRTDSRVTARGQRGPGKTKTCDVRSPAGVHREHMPAGETSADFEKNPQGRRLLAC